jgi:hypothetical protein
MGTGGRALYSQSSRTLTNGCHNQKKAGLYSESGVIWEQYERSQNLNKNISDKVLNGGTKCAKLLVLNAGLEDMARLPPVTARQEGATEIRIFLLEDEKDYLKQIASQKNVAVSHLARALLLAWAKDNGK